jgi:hypothetical protein
MGRAERRKCKCCRKLFRLDPRTAITSITVRRRVAERPWRSRHPEYWRRLAALRAGHDVRRVLFTIGVAFVVNDMALVLWG